jgi:hypothetical protein
MRIVDPSNATKAREKLCLSTFHELLRHVGSLSADSSALLARVWKAWQGLVQGRVDARVQEMTALISTGIEDRRAADQSAADERLAALQREHRRLQVSCEALELDKQMHQQLLSRVQSESDGDLAHANKLLCERELSLMRLQRSFDELKRQLEKRSDDTHNLVEDKLVAETALRKSEEQREELATAVAELKQQVDVRSRQLVAQGTQYERADFTDAEQERKHVAQRAVVAIQSWWRGVGTRKRLMPELRARAKALKERQEELANLHHVPRIPAAFLHLMAGEVVTKRRKHFTRILPRKRLLKWITFLLDERWNSSKHLSGAKHSSTMASDFADFLYELHLFRHGMRDATEVELVRAVRGYSCLGLIRLPLFCSSDGLVRQRGEARS